MHKLYPLHILMSKVFFLSITSMFDRTQQFLALFNTIDKYFDQVLHQDSFLPFNEKLKRLSHGDYHISHYVNLHYYNLKFLGELRNHITHGIKLDGKSYANPSTHAIKKCEHYLHKLTSPPTIGHIFQKNVFEAKTTDLLSDIMPRMQKNNYTHIPVYDRNDVFIGILTESAICYRLGKQLTHNSVNLNHINLAALPITHNAQDYKFFKETTSVYELAKRYHKNKEKNHRWAVALITPTGTKKEKLTGIVTWWDIGLLDKYLK